MSTEKRIFKRGGRVCGCSESCKFHPTFKVSSCPLGTPEPIEPQNPGGALAYGSLYNTSGIFIPTIQGNKIDFTSNGPLLGTIADLANDEIQVLTSGVYEISMDLSALLISNSANIPITLSNVEFRLFINDVTSVPESHFESHLAAIENLEGSIQIDNIYTIGKTIQLRLNANDRLSVKVFVRTGPISGQYRYPSLTVTKIAE